MAKKYWIGNFYVDPSRNQIWQGKDVQTLAPKAISVLTYLAKNQRVVVSQEKLLEEVWKGTIVSSNTLQRSIAQIRKALGDEGTTYIKTHAKRGYSLECEISWQTQPDIGAHESTNEQSSDEAPNKSNLENANSVVKVESRKKTALLINTGYRSRYIYIITLVLLIAMTGYWVNTTKQAPALSFSELQALTASEHKEFSGIYSPDGQFVIFNRYENALCQNTLWAKNLETKQEFQLTADAGTYNGHSFTPDGKRLLLIQEQNCNQPVTQRVCYRLMSLDFNNALQSPQRLTEVMECKNSAIYRPIILNDNRVALLQKIDRRWQLVSYSLTSNSSQVLYTPKEGSIIFYDYSKKNNQFALTSVDENEDYYINMLSIDGELLSSNKIQFSNKLSKYRFITPKFSSIDGQLLYSSGRQLFTLSYDGIVRKVDLLLDEPIGTPNVHTNGQRMVFDKGYYDTDIVAIPLLQLDEKTVTGFSVLARSTTGEYGSILQPGGEYLAFKSQRSGDEQIWLKSTKGIIQLSNFAIDSRVRGFTWSSDGQSLLVNADRQLTQLFLDGKSKTFHLDKPVQRLFQWDSENNKVLALVKVKGITKLADIELSNFAIKVINQKSIQKALKTTKGQLLYIDYMNRFWLSGALEDQLIEALEGQGSSIGFVLYNDLVYGVNSDYQLWSYDLNVKRLTLLGKLPDNIEYITDVDQSNFYGVIKVTARKELAELFLDKS